MTSAYNPVCSSVEQLIVVNPLAAACAQFVIFPGNFANDHSAANSAGLQLINAQARLINDGSTLLAIEMRLVDVDISLKNSILELLSLLPVIQRRMRIAVHPSSSDHAVRIAMGCAIIITDTVLEFLGIRTDMPECQEVYYGDDCLNFKKWLLNCLRGKSVFTEMDELMKPIQQVSGDDLSSEAMAASLDPAFKDPRAESAAQAMNAVEAQTATEAPEPVASPGSISMNDVVAQAEKAFAINMKKAAGMIGTPGVSPDIAIKAAMDAVDELAETLAQAVVGAVAKEEATNKKEAPATQEKAAKQIKREQDVAAVDAIIARLRKEGQHEEIIAIAERARDSYKHGSLLVSSIDSLNKFFFPQDSSKKFETATAAEAAPKELKPKMANTPDTIKKLRSVLRDRLVDKATASNADLAAATVEAIDAYLDHAFAQLRTASKEFSPDLIREAVIDLLSPTAAARAYGAHVTNFIRAKGTEEYMHSGQGKHIFAFSNRELNKLREVAASPIKCNLGSILQKQSENIKRINEAIAATAAVASEKTHPQQGWDALFGFCGCEASPGEKSSVADLAKNIQDHCDKYFDKLAKDLNKASSLSQLTGGPADVYPEFMTAHHRSYRGLMQQHHLDSIFMAIHGTPISKQSFTRAKPTADGGLLIRPGAANPGAWAFTIGPEFRLDEPKSIPKFKDFKKAHAAELSLEYKKETCQKLTKKINNLLVKLNAHVGVSPDWLKSRPEYLISTLNLTTGRDSVYKDLHKFQVALYRLAHVIPVTPDSQASTTEEIYDYIGKNFTPDVESQMRQLLMVLKAYRNQL